MANIVRDHANIQAAFRSKFRFEDKLKKISHKGSSSIFRIFKPFLKPFAFRFRNFITQPLEKNLLILNLKLDMLTDSVNKNHSNTELLEQRKLLQQMQKQIENIEKLLKITQ